MKICGKALLECVKTEGWKKQLLRLVLQDSYASITNHLRMSQRAIKHGNQSFPCYLARTGQLRGYNHRGFHPLSSVSILQGSTFAGKANDWCSCSVCAWTVPWTLNPINPQPKPSE